MPKKEFPKEILRKRAFHDQNSRKILWKEISWNSFASRQKDEARRASSKSRFALEFQEISWKVYWNFQRNFMKISNSKEQKEFFLEKFLLLFGIFRKISDLPEISLQEPNCGAIWLQFRTHLKSSIKQSFLHTRFLVNYVERAVKVIAVL